MVLAFNENALILQVMIAVGRDPCTRDIGLEALGVKLNK